MNIYFKDPEDGTRHAVPWVDADDRTQPFSIRTLEYARALRVDRRGSHPPERDVAEGLRVLETRTDAPEATSATSRRRLLRNRALAKQVAKDRVAIEVVGLPPAAC